MDTYFFIQAVAGGNVWAELGPYVSFQEAAKIFLDHAEPILLTKWEKIPETYTIYIVECTIENGTRTVIHEKVREQRR